jgi:hypothetical protein
MRYFSWWWGAIVAFLYTLAVFGSDLSFDGPRIFSKRNARPLSVILAIHSAFLTTILGYASLMAIFLPRYNRAITAFADRRFLGFGLMIPVVCVYAIEQRLIFVKAGKDARKPGNNFSEPPTIENE